MLNVFRCMRNMKYTIFAPVKFHDMFSSNFFFLACVTGRIQYRILRSPILRQLVWTFNSVNNALAIFKRSKASGHYQTISTLHAGEPLAMCVQIHQSAYSCTPQLLGTCISAHRSLAGHANIIIRASTATINGATTQGS